MKEINWKEIGKLFNEDTLTEFAMDIERDILDKLDTHTTLDTLDYSFINLEKFVKKCFKEHNEE